VNPQPGRRHNGFELCRSLGELFNPESQAHKAPVRRTLFAQVLVFCGLTPELSRTAARNGGVVHVTMQPSREAVSA
jgi:hypothetical protein